MLEDRIKELKEQIAAANEAEAKQEEGVEVAQEAPEEVEQEAEKPVEEAKEEVKAEEVKEEPKKEELDDAGYARLRREAAAEKRRADELERKLAEARKPAEEVEEEVAIAPELAEVLQETRVNKAAREFTAYENDVKQKYGAEYEAVAGAYTQSIIADVAIDNPGMNKAQVSELAFKKILEKAGKYARAGYENPVEELFLRVKESGYGSAYKPPVKEVEVKEEPRPDMAKVAENRKRSAGTTAGAGEARMEISRASIMRDGMPTGEEWMKMSPAKRRELMYPQSA